MSSPQRAGSSKPDTELSIRLLNNINNNIDARLLRSPSTQTGRKRRARDADDNDIPGEDVASSTSQPLATSTPPTGRLRRSKRQRTYRYDPSTINDIFTLRVSSSEKESEASGVATPDKEPSIIMSDDSDEINGAQDWKAVEGNQNSITKASTKLLAWKQDGSLLAEKVGDDSDLYQPSDGVSRESDDESSGISEVSIERHAVLKLLSRVDESEDAKSDGEMNSGDQSYEDVQSVSIPDTGPSEVPPELIKDALELETDNPGTEFMRGNHLLSTTETTPLVRDEALKMSMSTSVQEATKLTAVAMNLEVNLNEEIDDDCGYSPVRNETPPLSQLYVNRKNTNLTPDVRQIKDSIMQTPDAQKLGIKGVNETPQDVERLTSDVSETDSDCDSDYGIDASYFLEASQAAEQPENWSALASEAADLRKLAEAEHIGVFNHLSIRLLGSIADAKDIFSQSQGLRHDGEDESYISAEENKILEIISGRIWKLLGRVDTWKGDLRKVSRVIDEIQVYIIPAAIDLLQHCLMAHFLDENLSIKGLDQLILLLEDFQTMCTKADARLYDGVEIPDRLKTVRVLLRSLKFAFKVEKAKGEGRW